MSVRRPLLERIREAPLVFDGAMGAMIYQRGVFLNACYDELCLTQPQLIRDLHAEYVEAGAEAIETNSFGANRVKLAAYGLADRVAAINRAAARLAREAAGAEVYVCGSVGPCFEAETPLDASAAAEMEAAWAEQIGALAEGGVDLIALETFGSLAQLRLAAAVARRTARVPVLASFRLPPGENDAAGLRAAEEAAAALSEDDNVDWIGLNCGRGPADLLQPLRRAVARASKPVIAMPNAGGPRQVGGRMLYLNSPEYFTEFCKRYLEVGVRGVGGCCGTTPAHIRMAARAVRGVSGARRHVALAAAPTAADGAGAARVGKPLAEKSPFAAKLAAGRPVKSVEVLPPAGGGGLAGFLAKCRACREAGVDAVNLPDGPRASARLSVLATALALRREVDLEPIPHYCCRDRNLIGMQSDLLGGFALGLKTWLFITGDPPKLGHYPDATGVFDLDAIGLARLADNLNHGFDAAGQPLDQPTAIAIGVGVNPAAVEPERELERFFRKIDAGAEFAFTQPVFDAEALLRFLDRARGYPRQIPIVAGLYPLLSLRNAEFMATHVPGVVVPERVLRRMAGCATKEDGLRRGIEIAREIRERVADGVAGFQAAAPLGRIDAALAVLA